MKVVSERIYWVIAGLMLGGAVAGLCLFALTQWLAPLGSDLHAPAWIVAGNRALHHLFPNLVMSGVAYVVGANLRPGHEAVAYAVGYKSHLLYTAAMVTWYFLSRSLHDGLRFLVIGGLLFVGTKVEPLIEPALFLVRPFVVPLFG